MQDGWVLSVMLSWPDATIPCCPPGVSATKEHSEKNQNEELTDVEISQRSTHHGVVDLVSIKRLLVWVSKCEISRMLDGSMISTQRLKTCKE